MRSQAQREPTSWELRRLDAKNDVERRATRLDSERDAFRKLRDAMDSLEASKSAFEKLGITLPDVLVRMLDAQAGPEPVEVRERQEPLPAVPQVEMPY